MSRKPTAHSRHLPQGGPQRSKRALSMPGNSCGLGRILGRLSALKCCDHEGQEHSDPRHVGSAICPTAPEFPKPELNLTEEAFSRYLFLKCTWEAGSPGSHGDQTGHQTCAATILYGPKDLRGESGLSRIRLSKRCGFS